MDCSQNFAAYTQQALMSAAERFKKVAQARVTNSKL